MTKSLIAALASFAFALGAAQASTHKAAPEMADAASKAPTAQQNKMKSCNKEAGDKALKGDERKAFMSQCLSGRASNQQDRMKSCNKEAGDKALKGDERKKFMSECLKG